MNVLHPKPTIGVMGSAQTALNKIKAATQKSLAERLGRAIADHGCTLITGATTGFPDLVSRAARAAGAFAIGVSPAQSREEHITRYVLPDDGADVINLYRLRVKVNLRAAHICRRPARKMSGCWRGLGGCLGLNPDAASC